MSTKMCSSAGDLSKCDWNLKISSDVVAGLGSE